MLSPYLFQGAPHFGLTSVIREPPFLRHFNQATPAPPGGSEADAHKSRADVDVAEKVAWMKDHDSWLLGGGGGAAAAAGGGAGGEQQEARLLCRPLLVAAAAASAAAAAVAPA